jgi:hypothetical protein
MVVGKLREIVNIIVYDYEEVIRFIVACHIGLREGLGHSERGAWVTMTSKSKAIEVLHSIQSTEKSKDRTGD